MAIKAKPQIISIVPMIFLYHLAGILYPINSLNGNTLAYFTYSFLYTYIKYNYKWMNFPVNI